MTATRFPVCWSPSRTGMASLTLSPLEPGTGITMGSAPVATTTKSGSKARTSSMVASLPISTVTSYLAICRSRYSTWLRTSRLKSIAPAAAMAPPKRWVFSHKVTSKPRSAAVAAAFMPPGPPPMTRILLGSLAGASTYSPSCMEVGFTAQGRGQPFIELKWHSPHPMHWQTSSSLPARTLLAQ